MSERTVKKTNAKQITDDELIVVRRKLAEGRDRLTHLHVEGVPKSEKQAMIEDYIAECEKAM